MIFIYNIISIAFLGIIINNKVYGKKEFNNNKAKIFYIVACFSQMGLIEGLRDISVGKDTLYYTSVYDGFEYSEYYKFLFTHYEIGFQTLYRILKFFNSDSQTMLMVVSGMTMFCFGIFIYNNSTNIILSTFLFACLFFPNSCNIMRQYLAISIAINAFSFIYKEKYVKGLFLIILGSLFHTIALLLIIPFSLFYVKKWKLIFKLLIPSSVLFFLFGNKIIFWLFSIVGKNFYLSSDYQVSRLFRATTVETFIIAIFFLFCINKIKDKKNIYILRFYICIALINFDFGILYLRYEFMSRVIELFNIFLLLSIPIIIDSVKSRYLVIIKIMTWIIPILIMINSVFNSGSGVENYIFCFNR